MSDWPAPDRRAGASRPGRRVRSAHRAAHRGRPDRAVDPAAGRLRCRSGRHAHLRIEASRHYPNEFCVLVGASGKGRKGSSWDHVEHLLSTADPDFTSGRLVSGLSSGEGLIAEVRDPLDRQRHHRARRQATARPRAGVRAGDEGPRARGEHPLARRSQQLGRQTPAIAGPQRAAARQRSARRDRRAHHQGRAAALPQRHRARQRLLQPLPAHRRAPQQAAAIRRQPRRHRAQPAQTPAHHRAPARPHPRRADASTPRHASATAISTSNSPTPARHVRRRHRPRRSAHHPPRADLRAARQLADDHPPAPRRRPRALALRTRLRPTGCSATASASRITYR